MESFKRKQLILKTCIDIENSNEIITIDTIFKRIDSKLTKQIISSDIKTMNPVLIQSGKTFIITEKGRKLFENA